MGFFKPPCRNCEQRVDCLAEEIPCPKGFIPLVSAFRYFFHLNPIALLVFLGITGCYISGVLFFIEWCTLRSSLVFFISLVSTVYTILVAVMYSAAKDLMLEHLKEIKRNGS